VITIAEPVIVNNFSSNQALVNVAVSYVLDGVSVTTSSTRISMWTSGAGGGLSTDFSESTGKRLRLDMSGPQLFSGPTNAPVLVTPQTVTNPGSWSYHNSNGTIITAGSYSDGLLTTTPEPGTMVLAGAGVLAMLRARSSRRLKPSRPAKPC
jgi:hypothetical protein